MLSCPVLWNTNKNTAEHEVVSASPISCAKISAATHGKSKNVPVMLGGGAKEPLKIIVVSPYSHSGEMAGLGEANELF